MGRLRTTPSEEHELQYISILQNIVYGICI